MNFELGESERQNIEPMVQEMEQVTNSDWKISLEKLEALAEGDPNLEEMLADLLDQSLRYTKTVLDEMQTFQTEGAGEEHAIKDKQRSITHTATQDTVRAFVRNLIKAGKKQEDVYAVLPRPDSRAACGQFALRLTLTRGATMIGE